MINKISHDIRVFRAIEDAKRNDNSFTDKSIIPLLSRKYSTSEVRDIWFQAMAIGMEQGLHMASLEGQRIDITNNCENEKHKEFLEKFYELAREYNCAIVYNMNKGMCVMDLNR